MDGLTPEELARKNIDKLLESAGWNVQDLKDYDLSLSSGVAIREFSLCQIHAWRVLDFI